MTDLELRHQANLNEMLALVNQTLNELGNPGKVGSKREVALRRWMMMLGAMLLNVGQSVSRLMETRDAVAIKILGRTIFEYRTKAQYFLKDSKTRRIAFEQYETIESSYFKGLERLTVLHSKDEEKFQKEYDAFVQMGGKKDLLSGKVGVTSMVVALARTSDVQIDSDGEKYTHDLAAGYNLPSWFVHGSVSLIAEFFHNWEDDSDWSFSKTPLNHSDVLPEVHAASSNIFQYLHSVRSHYDMSLYALSLAGQRAQALIPKETLRQFEELKRKKSDLDS